MQKRIVLVYPAKWVGGVFFGVYDPPADLEHRRGRRTVKEVRSLSERSVAVWEHGADNAAGAMQVVWEACRRGEITELEVRVLEDALNSWAMEPDAARMRLVVHRKPVPRRLRKKSESSAEADVRPRVLPMGARLALIRARKNYPARVKRHPDARG